MQKSPVLKMIACSFFLILYCLNASAASIIELLIINAISHNQLKTRVIQKTSSEKTGYVGGLTAGKLDSAQTAPEIDAAKKYLQKTDCRQIKSSNAASRTVKVNPFFGTPSTRAPSALVVG